jgi:hypothetical protein
MDDIAVINLFKKKNNDSWGYSSVVEHLSNIHEALRLIFSTVKKKKKISGCYN